MLVDLFEFVYDLLLVMVHRNSQMLHHYKLKDLIHIVSNKKKNVEIEYKLTVVKKVNLPKVLMIAVDVVHHLMMMMKKMNMLNVL
jgi:hypothetical protein